MYLNHNDNTVIQRPQEITVKGITYPKQVFGDDMELATLNIAKAEVGEMADPLYFDNIEVIDWVNSTVSYESTPKSKEEIRLLTVPMSISMRQCRLKLNEMGILDGITSAVKNAGGEAEIEWEYASNIEIDNPLVLQVGQIMGMSQDDIDTMFIESSKL